MSYELTKQQRAKINAEKCTNCGGAIPAMSQAFVHHDKVVCRTCKDELDASTVPCRFLMIYIICFALPPAALVGFLEHRYHIFFRYSHNGEALIVFGSVAVFLFGVVLAVWRTANKPKGEN